jgi:predicted lipoprotein with Yx(FWY)xxD motif
VWFLVAPDARLIQDPAPAGAAGAQAQPAASTVALAQTPLGEVLVDAEGHTLYGFTKDADGTPTCAGDCADAWPAELVEGDIVPGAGLDAATFSLVDGIDGGQQLKAGKWQLYRFAGDAAPGEVNGQGSGGVWFAVAADGSLVKE